MPHIRKSRCYASHVRHCLAGAAVFTLNLMPVAHAAEFQAVIPLSSLDGTNGFRLEGAADRDRTGKSVSAAGDINGDGFGDVIVGAPESSPNGIPVAGSCFVVFGKASGFAEATNLSTLNGQNGFRLDGTDRFIPLGRSVSAAGDVNGDGFDDLILGNQSTNVHGQSSGSSYVVFGKASGFAPAMALSSLNGSNGFRIDGAAANDDSGISVSGAGDVNGDGFGDVIIGATGTGFNGKSSGSSYVVFGKAPGFAPAINLASLNGNNGFRLDGAYHSQTGYSVSGAGDVNGDGFDDVIVGAVLAAPFGSSYVVFGKTSGFSPAIDLSTLDGGNGFRIDGMSSIYRDGAAVSAAGDINGDGFSDLILGSPFSSPNGIDSGSSFVVFGKASGFGPVFSLSNVNGANGFRLDGVEAYDVSGRAVSEAGDVNGDGFDDLLVSAPQNFRPGGYGDYTTDVGKTYVVFGKGLPFAPKVALSGLNGNNGCKSRSNIPSLKRPIGSAAPE